MAFSMTMDFADLGVQTVPYMEEGVANNISLDHSLNLTMASIDLLKDSTNPLTDTRTKCLRLD